MSASSSAHPPQLPAESDVVVIGAGLGGLTCALRLASAGLSVCVLEQHRVPGGYAHSFRRKGYEFDVSLHYIGGFAPGQLTHGILDSVGVLPKLGLRRRDTLFAADFPDLPLLLPNDREAILAQLGERFPAERANLRRLFAHMQQLKFHVMGPWIDPDFDVPPAERLQVGYLERTFLDLLQEFVRDRRLLAILGQLWMYIGLPPGASTATFSTCVFCSPFMDGAYSLAGGGAALTRAMAERLAELGGACVTRAPVSRIVLEAGRAVGVELEGGAQVPARAVISAANPHQTFFELIPGDEISRLYRYRIQQMQPSLSLYAIYLGLDCPPAELGIASDIYFFNHDFDLEQAYGRVLDHDIDHTDWCLTADASVDHPMSPPGTGIVSIAEPTPAGDWLDLDDESYRGRKAEVQARLLDKYDRRFPGLARHAAVQEFATPRTMVRFTRNHRGAVYGLAQRVDQSNAKRLRHSTPVERLYLTGAWTWSGGGYEGAMMSGVQTAATVLRELEAPRPAPRIRLDPPPLPPPSAAAAAPAAASGAPLPDPHRMPVLLSGDDLDATGRVSAEACLRLMDRGRVEAIEELCRRAGQPSWLRRYVINVYRLQLTMGAPAQLADALAVESALRQSTEYRAAFDQRVLRGADDVARALVEVLFLDERGQLAPLPEEVSRLLDPGTAPEPAAPPPVSPVPHPHRSAQRVYYEDTDAQGIAYHVAYLRFCQRALWQMLRELDAAPATSAPPPSACAVHSLCVRFVKAARLGDLLEVRSRASQATQERLRLEQQVVLVERDQIAAEVALEVVLCDAAQRPVVPPPGLLAPRGASAAGAVR